MTATLPSEPKEKVTTKPTKGGAAGPTAASTKDRENFAQQHSEIESTDLSAGSTMNFVISFSSKFCCFFHFFRRSFTKDLFAER